MTALGQRISFRLARQFPSATVQAQNSGPLVSFTFDDAPISAATTAAGILEDHGFRGTFYLSGGWLGGDGDVQPIMSAEQARELARRRHEIACHTYAHLDVGAQTWGALKDDLDKNRQCLADITGVEPTNFAYPFGRATYAKRQKLQSRFATCRGVVPGLNVNRIDLGLLRAAPLYGPEGADREVDRWIAANAERGGWLIFVTHDVRDNPTPYGTPPKVFSRVVKAALRSGAMCMTVKQAIDCVRGPTSAPAETEPAAGILLV